MKINKIIRKLHYWGTIIVTIPLLIVIGSGLLLMVKKHWDWVQPVAIKGSSELPTVSFATMLEKVQAAEGLSQIQWEDVDRIDVRPGKGMAKIRLKNGYEVQVDLADGRVLQVAYRRSDMIEAIHDGSFFVGEISKFGVFLPAALVLLFMAISGIWLFVLPFLRRRSQG